MIVDDHPGFRQAVRDFLPDYIEQVVECDSGERASDLFQHEKPDAVLMDIEMPDVDGLAATRAIKRINPKALIVVVSQHDDLALRAEAEAAGASAYVLKDRLQDLTPVISSLLGETPGRRYPDLPS